MHKSDFSEGSPRHCRAFVVAVFGLVVLTGTIGNQALYAQDDDASKCLPAKNDPQEVSSLDDPGAIRLEEMAACISEIDGNFAWLRDVVLANDVEWLDRGYLGLVDSRRYTQLVKPCRLISSGRGIRAGKGHGEPKRCDSISRSRGDGRLSDDH